MKDYLKSTRSKIVLVVGAVMFGVWAVSGVLSIKDRIEVAKMTEKMKTVCVGRFLIDMPENANVVLRRARIDGFDIWTSPNESDAEFVARVAKREAEINAEPDERGRKNMELVREVKPEGMAGKIFIFKRTATPGLDKGKKVTWSSVSAEAYVRGNSVSVSFVTDMYTPDDVLANLEKLIEKLMPLAENEIPTEPGFCIERALVRDPLTPDQIEQVGMFAALPGHPDLTVVFHTIAGTVPSPSLLVRHAEVDAKEPLHIRALFTTLRERERIINNIPGVELVQKVRELNFSTVFAFQWESLDKQDDVFLPSIAMEIFTGVNPRPGGKPVQSSLSEAAGLDLWDKISSSVRVRPTKPPKVAEAPPPAITPLGTYASAHVACPQSGWWQCSDKSPSIEIRGGQTQYFRKGEAVPQAIIQTEPTFWQWLKRERPSHRSETPTQWKLVDYRHRPRRAPALPLAEAMTATPNDDAPPHVEVAANNDLEPRTPVGQAVATGATCPESGWWRCTEPGTVDGTRWFGQGKVLPAATFISKRTWADKLKGASSVTRQRSVWRFVRHDDGPVRQAASDTESAEATSVATDPAVDPDQV